MSFSVSEASICNMALARVGVTQRIQSISPPDQTNEAAQCALWYPICRDELLHDFNWPWATRYQPLSLVQLNPSAEWLYSYRYPTNAVRVVRLFAAPQSQPSSPPLTTAPSVNAVPLPQDRMDTNPCPWPWETGSDAEGELIYTSLVNAQCKFILQITNPQLFYPDFVMALAWRIAMELAMSLSIKSEYYDRAAKAYDKAIVEARACSAREQQISQPGVDYNSEFVRGRFSGSSASY